MIAAVVTLLEGDKMLSRRTATVLGLAMLVAGCAASPGGGGGPVKSAYTFTATLSGSQEVPPTGSPGTGTATVTLYPGNWITWSVVYSGLSGPAVAAHFHGPAKAGGNAPPVIKLGPDLDSPITGASEVTDDQIYDLKGGNWYVNIHTPANPGGEIRGQLTRVN
jgi:hypothetical protein